MTRICVDFNSVDNEGLVVAFAPNADVMCGEIVELYDAEGHRSRGECRMVGGDNGLVHLELVPGTWRDPEGGS